MSRLPLGVLGNHPAVHAGGRGSRLAALDGDGRGETARSAARRAALAADDATRQSGARRRGEPMCSRQAGCSGTVQDDLERSTYIYKTAAGGFVGCPIYYQYKTL